MNETRLLTQNRKRESVSVLIAAQVGSLGLIALNVWFWNLIDIVTPFLMPFITSAVWIVFLTIGIWSVVHICRKNRFRQPKAYIPLLIQLISAVIVLTVPFTAIMLNIDFRLNQSQMEEVVSKVISGELLPNVKHNSSLIQLPQRYRHLSKGGGEIVIEHAGAETYVFFYTYCGILDNFSGFMYRSDDTFPQNGNFSGDFFEIKRMSNKWFWTAAH